MSATRTRVVTYTVLIGSIVGSIYAWWAMQANPVLVPPNERGDVKIKEGLKSLKRKVCKAFDRQKKEEE
uniref:Ubiquinol-cytochrome-c reductase complex assembly factor 3 n=1 Tax=Trichuris muris TaxID=70415 RepID=A0A5S6PZW4_TRIMR